MRAPSRKPKRGTQTDVQWEAGVAAILLSLLAVLVAGNARARTVPAIAALVTSVVFGVFGVPARRQVALDSPGGHGYLLRGLNGDGGPV